MPGREVISEGVVEVGIDTRLAEAGLKKLEADYQRSFERMGREKAEGKLTVDTTAVDKDMADVKAKLLEFEKKKHTGEIAIDDLGAKASIADLKLKLKELGQKKTEIQVNSKQLRDANRDVEAYRKQEELMAAQFLKTERAQGQLTKAAERDTAVREKASRAAEKDALSLVKNRAEVLKLQDAYAELSKKKSSLEKEGSFTFGGWPGRTAEEARALEKVGADLDLAKHKIESLGGSIDGLDSSGKGGLTKKVMGWIQSFRALRISMGPISGTMGTFGAVLASLGPLIVSLIGGISALAGVIGAGLVGAAAVGAGALGAFALGLGGVALASKDYVTHVKAASAASTKLHEDIIKYGEGATETVKAQEELNNTLKGVSPAARKAFHDLGGLSDEWDNLTKKGRKPFFDAAGSGIETIKKLMPNFARETNKTMDVLGRSVEGFFHKLGGNESKGIMDSLMGDFRQSIPDIVHGFTNIAVAIGNIGQIGGHFLPGIASDFDNITKAFAEKSKTEAFSHKLGEMIHQAGDLITLFGTAGRTIALFFGAGASSGDEMVTQLNDTLTGVNEIMETTEGKNHLSEWFKTSALNTSRFLEALVPIVTTFTKLMNALEPVTGGMLVFADTLGEVVTWIAKLAPLRVVLETIGVALGAAFVANKIHGWVEAASGVLVKLGLMAGETDVVTAAIEAQTVAIQELVTAQGELGGSGLAAGAAAGAGDAAAVAGTIAEGAGAAGATAGGLAVGAAAAPVALALGGGLAFHAGEEHLIGAQATKASEPGGESGLERVQEVWKEITQKSKLGSLTFSKEFTKQINDAFKVKLDKAALFSNMRELETNYSGTYKNIEHDVRESQTAINATTAAGSSEQKEQTLHLMHAEIEAIRSGIHNKTIAYQTGRDAIKKIMHEERDLQHTINQDMTHDQSLMALAYRHTFDSLNKATGESLKELEAQILTTMRNFAYSTSGNTTIGKFRATHGSVAPGSGSHEKFTPDHGKVVEGQARGGLTRVEGRGREDSVPLYANGAISAVVAPGEDLMVVNSHQRPLLDAAVADKYGVGGMPGFFNRYDTPHMAAGGITEPQLHGPDGFFKDAGQAGLHQDTLAARKKAARLQRRARSVSGGVYEGPTPPGVGSWGGFPVDKWIIPELNYARAHGWHGDITSGWRTEAKSAELGFPHDEHTKTSYPGGAVDFGGMTDPAGAANRAAFIRATAGYKGAHLLTPEGFHDDGHMSGTGHAKGGIVAERFAQSVAAHHAPYDAAMALFEAGITETGDATLSTNPSGGDSSSRGALQLLSETAAGDHVNPMNIRAVADLFLTKGYTGAGGAISLSPGDPGSIAQAVQGSEFPERYGQHSSEAAALIKAMGLEYDGQGFKGFNQHGTKKLTANQKFEKKHPKGSTSAGGGTYAPAASKKEIRNTDVGAQKKSKLPSWGGLLPRTMQEELEGRDVNTEEREGVLGLAATKASGMVSRDEAALSKTVAKAHREHKFGTDEERVGRSKIGEDKELQKKAAEAGLAFDKGIIAFTTEEIKGINSRLAHGKLNDAEKRKEIERRTRLEQRRDSAREDTTTQRVTIAEDEAYGEQVTVENEEEAEEAATYAGEVGGQTPQENQKQEEILNAQSQNELIDRQRYDFYNAFSNTVREASNPSPPAYGHEALNPNFGDRPGQSTEADTPPIIITNNFASPPPDAHTWTRNQQFEIGALA